MCDFWKPILFIYLITSFFILLVGVIRLFHHKAAINNIFWVIAYSFFWLIIFFDLGLRSLDDDIKISIWNDNNPDK